MSSSGSSRRSSNSRAAAQARGGRACPGSADWRGGLHARAALIVDHADGKVLGPRFVRLLEAIEATGSVRQATATVGLGYRHAITWIRRAESVLGYALVVRHVGGAAGGGSDLTAEGVRLVRSYRRVTRAIDRLVRQAESEILCTAGGFAGMR